MISEECAKAAKFRVDRSQGEPANYASREPEMVQSRNCRNSFDVGYMDTDFSRVGGVKLAKSVSASL